MRALEFLTSHVTVKLRYNQIYQLKTTIVVLIIIGLNTLKMYAQNLRRLLAMPIIPQRLKRQKTF